MYKLFFLRRCYFRIQVAFGTEEAINTLRSALAMGADKGIFIKTHERPDSMITARTLRAAIEQDGKPDIIFTGKESVDSLFSERVCTQVATTPLFDPEGERLLA